MIVCADCGYSNPDDTEFCRSCNTFLGWEGTRVESGHAEGGAGVGGKAEAAVGGIDAGSGGGTATGSSGVGGGAAPASSAAAGSAAASSTASGTGSTGALASGGGLTSGGIGGGGLPGGTPLAADAAGTRAEAAAGAAGHATGGRATRHDGVASHDSASGHDSTAGQDRAAGQDGATRPERATDLGVAAKAVLTDTAFEQTAAPETAQTGSTTIDARQPMARQPARIVQRRPLRPVDEPRPQPVTGERACPNCGRGNPPMRRFCGSCGRSLEIVAEEEQLPWWRRLLNRLTSRRQRSRRPAGIARRILKITAVLGVLAVLVVVGSPLVSRGITAVRDRMQPSDPMRPVEVIASSSHGPETLPERISDGATNRYWAPRGPAVDAWVEASFAEPIRITDILIHSGISKEQEQFLTVGRPHELALIATTDDGDTVEETLVLQDRPGEQRFTFRASDVVRLRLIIRSTFGPESQPAAALAEVEFFGRR